MTKLRSILSAQGLAMEPSTIGKYHTDGTKFAAHLKEPSISFAISFLEGQNNMGSPEAEPYIQSIVYYVEEVRKHERRTIEGTNLPINFLICDGRLLFSGESFNITNEQHI